MQNDIAGQEICFWSVPSLVRDSVTLYGRVEGQKGIEIRLVRDPRSRAVTLVPTLHPFWNPGQQGRWSFSVNLPKGRWRLKGHSPLLIPSEPHELFDGLLPLDVFIPEKRRAVLVKLYVVQVFKPSEAVFLVYA